MDKNLKNEVFSKLYSKSKKGKLFLKLLLSLWNCMVDIIWKFYIFSAVYFGVKSKYPKSIQCILIINLTIFTEFLGSFDENLIKLLKKEKKIFLNTNSTIFFNFKIAKLKFWNTISVRKSIIKKRGRQK